MQRRRSSRKSISAEIEHARKVIDFGGDVSDDDEGAAAESDEEDDSPAVPYAFAFDIDGVLLRGGHTIPQAKEAMAILNGKNERHLKIPYIFITNGGGKLEDARCRELAEKLDVETSVAQFIQSHTPFQQMTTLYETVLVVGGEGNACREIAESYGFKNVITPGDIIAWDPSIVPFRTLRQEELDLCKPRDFSKIKIEAIFFFADSRDWASDAQIIIDVLLSKDGYLHSRNKEMTQACPIFFSNPDITWSTDHCLPRFGLGALRLSISALWDDATDGKTPLKLVQLGKPYGETYRYATRLLTEWRALEHGIEEPPRHIYMVGDNPESDIRGANMAGWESLLVLTGVYKEEQGPPKYKPTTIQKDVLEAVKWAIEREEKIGGF
ncbi:HAD-like domain-containing protein [Protomyces lactucae-debilis]|uniref:HAD-like domain-containing protein n=1 Tax=Protomyces lactucae-debilis TaxID=2754530 RepID=A0A1Y2EQ33_PROLT|nr:HAD-like domain-containing protein [Protomyces lactucae-debilis]ORY73659.1 HAD-like domain-containing protein [Protomyces lactucae-debilis]